MEKQSDIKPDGSGVSDNFEAIRAFLEAWSAPLAAIAVLCAGFYFLWKRKNIVLSKFPVFPKKYHKNISFIQVSKNRLTSLEVINDDYLISAGFTGNLYRTDFETNQTIILSKGLPLVRSLLNSSDLESLLIGCDDGDLYVYSNTLSRSIKILSFGSPIFKIVQDEQFFYAALGSGEVVKFEIRSAATLNSLEFIGNLISKIDCHSGSCFGVAVDTAGGLTSVGSDGNIIRSSFQSQEVRKIAVTSVAIFSLLNIESKKIHICGDNSGLIRVFDEHLSKLDEFPIHQQNVRTIYASDNAKWFVSGGKDKTIMIWNTDGSSRYAIGRATDYIYDIEYDRNRKTIIVAEGTGQVVFIKLPKDLNDMEDQDFKFFEDQAK